MKWIAITGRSYVGKTRLAKHLEEDGYLPIWFSERLKRIACQALSHLAFTWTIQTEYAPSLDTVHAQKEKYRSFLIGLGQAIGYDRDPIYIEAALEHWYEADRPPACFDNVRSVEQADYLRSIGFQIVELACPFEVRRERAAWCGKVLTQEMAEADMRLPDSYVVDLTLDGTAPSSVIARQLRHHE